MSFYHIDPNRFLTLESLIASFPSAVGGGEVTGNLTDLNKVDVTEFKYWKNVAGVGELATIAAFTSAALPDDPSYTAWANTDLGTITFTTSGPIDGIPLASFAVVGGVAGTFNDLRTPYGKPAAINALIPTVDEKAALAGASDGGAPSGSNEYVVDDDVRLNHLWGTFIDKGSLLADHSIAVPSSLSEDVSTAFNGTTGSLEAPSDESVIGVVTTAPNNYVHLLNQNKDEMIHTVHQGKIFGRITEAAGVWTLTFKTVNASGAEVFVTDLSADTTLAGALTDVQMVKVSKLFAANDPARPKFPSGVAVADQLVGDIPLGTEFVHGKVRLAGNTITDTRVVQSQDTRLPTQDENDALVGDLGNSFSGTLGGGRVYVLDDDVRLPTTDENDALQGAVTGGAPTLSNRYVVDDDSRFGSIFTPAYYFGVSSAAAANQKLLFAGTVASPVVSSGISQDVAGLFTVTDAGKYLITLAASVNSGAGINLHFMDPGSIVSPATFGANDFAQNSSSGIDNNCVVVTAIRDFAGSGTFDVGYVLGAGASVVLLNEVTQITIHRIA
jgi:hypothetical protein